MRDFVRAEVWPIETVFEELGRGRLRAGDRAAAGAGQGARPVGRPPAARAGRPGLRPGQARPHARDPRQLAVRAVRVRQQRARLRQRRDARAGRHARPEGASGCEPLLAGDLRSAFSMTEPATAGSDPTLLETRAVEDGDGWVIDGHKWFSSNGSVADFLIVMAVTDPDAARHQRASMFIVPADTPGRDGSCATSRRWSTRSSTSAGIGGHAEIVYEGVRVPKANLLGARGAGFLIAQQRLGPGRIHHCMRWLGVSRRAFDMLCERALSALRARLAAGRQADGAELDRRLGGADARGAADDAARGVADRHRGRGGGAPGDRADQVLRRRACCTTSSTARCRRTARSATRPTCRWRRCTASRARRGSTTAPTRSTASRSRGHPARLRGAGGRRAERARADPRGPRRASAFAGAARGGDLK